MPDLRPLGLSKVCALPGLKCAWIVASGPDAEAAADRLELVADTFLSVNTPVQVALPALLGGRAAVQDAIRARLAENLAALDAARPEGAPWDRVTGADGWYAVLRVPATRSDEAWAEALLADGVVVHPGHLYDLPGTHLVLCASPSPRSSPRGCGGWPRASAGSPRAADGRSGAGQRAMAAVRAASARSLAQPTAGWRLSVMSAVTPPLLSGTMSNPWGLRTAVVSEIGGGRVLLVLGPG